MNPRDAAADHVMTMITKLRQQARMDREEAQRINERAARKETEASYLAAMLEASALGTDPKVDF